MTNKECLWELAKAEKALLDKDLSKLKTILSSEPLKSKQKNPKIKHDLGIVVGKLSNTLKLIPALVCAATFPQHLCVCVCVCVCACLYVHTRVCRVCMVSTGICMWLLVGAGRVHDSGSCREVLVGPPSTTSTGGNAKVPCQSRTGAHTFHGAA